MLWINNPFILLNPKELIYFVPSSNRSWLDNSNAIIRFIFYLSIILYFYYSNPFYLSLPIIFMLIQYILHKYDKLKTIMTTFFPHNNVDISENFYDTPAKYDLFEGFSNFKQYGQNSFADQIVEKNVHIENMGSLNADEPLPKSPEYIETKTSTVNNPFGNSLPYDNIDRQITPITPNEDVKKMMFRENLFDNSDIFQKNNNERNFTTNPSTTIPNDQDAFAQYLYNTPYTLDD